jgi:peroxiredoxin
MIIVMSERGEFECCGGGGLWLMPDEFWRVTGWTLKPEGMCRDELCIPLPSGARRADRIDTEAVWRMLGNPVLHDQARTTWVLGSGVEDRTRALAGLVAPDFALPDFDGRLHRLSDLRGKKVFLATWASWCGCRFDLPIWQRLYGSVRGHDFMIVSVAEETRGAEHARRWVEEAKAEYWCLVDTDHRVADLYGMVNVPQCVWIDEAGQIVRPPEVAGSTDHFRRMDRATRTMAPEDRAQRDAARQLYIDAVRDWVLTGKHALSGDAVRVRLPRITPEIASAHAHFRLGVWLRRHGKAEEGDRYLAEASRLYPQSWNMFRQAADLREVGLASGPEFWDRVLALGEHHYYTPPEIEAFPQQVVR